MILVTGATGRTGLAVIRELAGRGTPVRAMLHPGSKNADVLKGVEVVEADFTRPDQVAAALSGVDHAYLVTPPVEPAMGWQLKFVQLAVEKGVSHVVKLSMLDADLGSRSRFQRGHAEVEQAIRDSGLGWTFLRANFFQQTALQYLVGDALYAIGGESQVSMVDLRDVARVAAIALTAAGHEQQVYELTGPAPIAPSDIARELSTALGSDIKVQSLPYDQAREVMASSGFPEWNRDGVVELNEWFHTPRAAVVTDTVSRLTGSPARSFSDLAREAAAAFSA